MGNRNNLLERLCPPLLEKFQLYDGIIIILGTSVLAHFLFSRFGFNPTDDGFILAYSRRLLRGEIPHLDFISIRPVLSPLIHLPELAFAPEHALMLSRFVFWLELSITGWVGTDLILRESSFCKWQKQAAFFLTFFFCAHSFPAMAWHSVDGLCLATCGFYLTRCKGERLVMLGYFLLGLAPLCKQNFAIVGPVVLLANRHILKLGCWAIMGAPTIFYILVLSLLGGGSEMAVQIRSHSNIFRYGIEPFIDPKKMAAIFLGLLTCLLQKQEFKKAPYSIFPALLGLVYLVWALIELGINGIRSFSFYLFNFYLGILLGRCALIRSGQNSKLEIGFVMIVVSWAVSISIGYQSPALGSGLILICILEALWSLNPIDRVTSRLVKQICIIVVGCAALIFYQQRTRFIYRDLDANQLTRGISHVLPGTKGVLTNERTEAFLTELQILFNKWAQKQFDVILLPGVPAFWLSATRVNNFPIDWAQGTELSTENLRQKIFRFLEGVSDQTVFIIPKIEVSKLASVVKKINNEGDYYFFVNYISAHYHKIDESIFLEVFRK